MPRSLTDHAGKTFGNLLAISPDLVKKNYWNCLCACGNNVSVQTGHMISGRCTSCGCTRKKHGMYGTPTYISWQAMLQRCTNPNNTNYSKYGGSGVTVSDLWNPANGGSFENFFKDMGPRPLNTSLNRIAGAKHYNKENCEWAKVGIQSFDKPTNKRNKFGITGVRYRKEKDAYESRISKDNKQLILYYGSCFTSAIISRLQAEKEYYPELFEARLIDYIEHLKTHQSSNSELDLQKILDLFDKSKIISVKLQLEKETT